VELALHPPPPAPAAFALDGATVAFDLDGTLVDTAPDLTRAVNDLLALEGLRPLNGVQVRQMIGGGPRAMIVRAFAAAGVALTPTRLDDLTARFLVRYRACMGDESAVFPGAAAALDVLIEAGARLCVCTNKPTELAEELLSDLGLAERFAAIVGPDAARAAKPDAAHLIAAITRAGGVAARSVMVGDSLTDVEVARAAAIPVVLFDFGYGETAAGELSPDIVISQFDQLPGACQRLLFACEAHRQRL
jgi:phosphoglycolate phosphatase